MSNSTRHNLDQKINYMPVIVGSGMIAKAMRSISPAKPVLILASGVSNSSEQSPVAFAREAALIQRSILVNNDRHVIYFSSCAISAGVDSPYVRHKIRMEALVRICASSYQIIRLPQVVGVVDNSTLISHLVRSILKGQEIQIQKRATRHLIATEDVCRLTELVINEGPSVRSSLNLAPKFDVVVTQILGEIEDILGCRAKAKLVDTGERQFIDTEAIFNLIDGSDVILKSTYWRLVLADKVPKIASVIKSQTL